MAIQDSRPRDLRERTFQFAVSVVKLCRHLEARNGVSRIMARQLLRAGTSIGANIEEGQAAQSKPDFINKNSIALKEARETHYWLRLLAASEEVSGESVADLQKEVGELMCRGCIGAKGNSMIAWILVLFFLLPFTFCLFPLP